MSKIDNMRAAMVAAGFYKMADIEEICRLWIFNAYVRILPRELFWAKFNTIFLYLL